MGKLLGRLISTIVIGGVVAAGVAYALEKLEYRKDLKDDFDEFDDDYEDEDFSDVDLHPAPAAKPATEEDIFVDEGTTEPEKKEPVSRAASANYVSLNSNKEKLTQAAKDTLDAAKVLAVLAGAALDMAKDMGGIVKEESGKFSGDMGAKLGQAAATVKEETGKILHGSPSDGQEDACPASGNHDAACDAHAEAAETCADAPSASGETKTCDHQSSAPADTKQTTEPDAPTITISEE